MTSTGPRPVMSIGKKLLFSLAAVALVAVVVELSLWAAGIERLVEQDDPFRGFSGLIRVFERDGELYRTRRHDSGTFNDQSFLARKPANGVRIFCLGGSSSYGFPWGAPAAFTAVLGDVLAAAHPTLEIEAVNASGVSYGMHRLNIVADELLEYEPDIFVVYSGHNEFIEPAFFDALKHRSPVRNRIEYVLAHSRVYSGMHALLQRPAPASDTAEDAVELAVRRDHSRRYANADKQAVVDEYRRRLRRLVRRARAAGVQSVLVTVPCNLRDWHPEASLPENQGGGAAWSAALSAGESLLKRNEPANALEAFRRAVELAPEHAGARYAIAQALDALGRWDEARAAYVQACDYDASPSRRISGINEAIREIARDEDALLVDADTIYTNESEHGLVGFNLIEDYVHPTVEGHRRIAWHLWQAIEDAGWLPDRAPAEPELFDRVVAERGSPVNERNFTWQYNQGVILENQGSDVQAMQKYREALTLNPTHWGAMGNLARLLGEHGQLDEARVWAERLVEANPDHPRYLSLLGVILARLGNATEAETRLEQALELREDDALSHHHLGRVLEQSGRRDEARAHYDRALELRPDLADFHEARGRQLLQQGDTSAARFHWERLITNPTRSADAHYNLGQLATKDGDPARAVRHYEDALGIAPDHLGALLRSAWILATSADSRLRDGVRALPRARRAAELTEYRDAGALDTLAAAAAAAGSFDEAVRWQTECVELAPERFRPQVRARLELYRSGRPYVAD